MSLQLLKCAAISAKLKETQESMHAFFGTRWPRKKEEALRVIVAVMKQEHCQVLAAAQKAANWAMNENKALFAAIVLAAAVDVIESGEELAA